MERASFMSPINMHAGGGLALWGANSTSRCWSQAGPREPNRPAKPACLVLGQRVGVEAVDPARAPQEAQFDKAPDAEDDAGQDRTKE